MAVDPTLWMPAEMDSEEKQAWADAFPTDPHKAAGAAWESWATQIKNDGNDVEVTSVSTGAQSISYARPTSDALRAMEIARWHYARSGGSAVRSPDYPSSGTAAPDVSFGWNPPTWPRAPR